MKVEVNGNPAQKSEYPCLKISKVTGNIVLFSAPKTGTVLSIGGSENSLLWDVAEYSTSFDESCFTKLDGSITLSND